MAPPDPPNVDVIFSWSVVEWLLGGAATAMTGLAGIGIWIFQIGRRVGSLLSQVKDLETDVGKMEMALDRRMIEVEAGRVALKTELLEHIRDIAVRVNDLPSRMFVENQLTAMVARLDRIIDAKVHP